MKRWNLTAALLALAFCLSAAAAFAEPFQGLPRKVKTLVETSDKPALMDLVQNAFEERGYRLQKRTGVDIVMERRLSGYLYSELGQMLGYYWSPVHNARPMIKDPVERIYLSVVRATTTTTGIEAYRALVANPATAFEGAVADDSRKRSGELAAELEQIRTEAEERFPNRPLW